MKLTVEKLTQIIREEVENVTNEASRTGVGAAPRGYSSKSRRSRKEKWADNSDPAYTPRKQRPGVSEETFDKIIDAISELPGSPGKPEKKSDEQGAGFVALRDFFLANEKFYKELVRQANTAWMESGPEDKITDALHAKGGLFNNLDPKLGEDVSLVLQILDGVNPAKFARLKRKKE